MNKILLQGTVGRNPETRYIQKGWSFSKFSLVTRDTVTGAGGNMVEEVEWHEIVAWRNWAEYADLYVKRGDTVYVEGKLKSRYVNDGPESGHRIYEVIACQIQVLARSRQNSSAPIPDSAETAVGCGLPGFDIENIPMDLKNDDLPF